MLMSNTVSADITCRLLSWLLSSDMAGRITRQIPPHLSPRRTNLRVSCSANTSILLQPWRLCITDSPTYLYIWRRVHVVHKNCNSKCYINFRKLNWIRLECYLVLLIQYKWSAVIWQRCNKVRLELLVRLFMFIWNHNQSWTYFDGAWKDFVLFHLFFC